MKKKGQPEYKLQVAVCEYLRLQYRDVIFMSDTIASLKLTKPQQQRAKAIQKTDFHCPDLLILEPRTFADGEYFAGLFLELKIVSPYYKSNPTVLKVDPHIEAQAESIQRLNKKGYHATFAWDFDEIKKLIDSYLKGKNFIR